MLKKSLFVAVAVAMLAVSAQAGEIKVHEWPTAWVAQELGVIPVTMNIGYWVALKSQNNNKIKMSQTDTNSFSGCTNVTVANNFALTLTSSIAQTGPVNGNYGTNFGPGINSVDLSPGSNSVQVCASLTGADLKDAAPHEDVTVAQVTLYVKPQAAP